MVAQMRRTLLIVALLVGIACRVPSADEIALARLTKASPRPEIQADFPCAARSPYTTDDSVVRATAQANKVDPYQLADAWNRKLGIGYTTTDPKVQAVAKPRGLDAYQLVDSLNRLGACKYPATPLYSVTIHKGKGKIERLNGQTLTLTPALLDSALIALKAKDSCLRVDEAIERARAAHVRTWHP